MISKKMCSFRNYFFTIIKNNYYIAHSLFYTYFTEKNIFKRKHLWYVTHLFTIIYKNIFTNVCNYQSRTDFSVTVTILYTFFWFNYSNNCENLGNISEKSDYKNRLNILFALF